MVLCNLDDPTDAGDVYDAGSKVGLLRFSRCIVKQSKECSRDEEYRKCVDCVQILPSLGRLLKECTANSFGILALRNCGIIPHERRTRAYLTSTSLPSNRSLDMERWGTDLFTKT